ncbi:hypothetical protein IW262DRAFT_1462695 [Armillaria fumosa]|nr:hypothetical protein IW262DRAFT_1462695 [Armillaria fumosa]
MTAIIYFSASFIDFRLHFYLDHDHAVKVDIDNGYNCKGRVKWTTTWLVNSLVCQALRLSIDGPKLLHCLRLQPVLTDICTSSFCWYRCRRPATNANGRTGIYWNQRPPNQAPGTGLHAMVESGLVPVTEKVPCRYSKQVFSSRTPAFGFATVTLMSSDEGKILEFTQKGRASLARWLGTDATSLQCSGGGDVELSCERTNSLLIDACGRSKLWIQDIIVP